MMVNVQTLSLPQLSEVDAVRIAREYYGLPADRAELLYGEEALNFRILNPAGESHVLKISRESPETIALQLQMLRHVAARGTVRCSAPVPASDGSLLLELEDRNGDTCRARLLTYVPGDRLCELGSVSLGLLRSIGRFFGDLDRGLRDFWHPAATRELPWDLKHAVRVRPLIPRIASATVRRHVDLLLHRFTAFAAPTLSRLRHGVIHNDGNDHNILVGPSNELGLIDFGDAVWTATVCEIAVVGAYAILGRDDLIPVLQAVTSGYHERIPLTDTELEILVPLVGARLSVSACVAAARREEQPDNAYLQVSQGAIPAALERLVATSSAKALEALRDACGTKPISPSWSRERILESREEHLGPSLSISYREPLHIIRGSGPYLFAESGEAYLDLVNNVCHVGHCHPDVVAAAHGQIERLNTNTRYLSELRARYVERLCSLFPDPLNVCFLVCSGSEANDLALRLARNHTGAQSVIVVDGAYHGTTQSTVEISPYKFDGPGGAGAPPYVHPVSTPDVYRGRFGRGDPEAGAKYASEIAEVLERLSEQGERMAAFICESLMGVAGQIELPPGYLAHAYSAVRAAGGVCIADEVQVGFGRVGTHFWGFETQGMIPDIVTLGKPIGNGHPLAAVITNAEIAASFANGMEYFNTFGGNPVSCAIGEAVLEVIEREQLQSHARIVGTRLEERLRNLASRHPLIGDVRGRGLFLGLELVRDREEKTPADLEATEIVERMKSRRFLLSIDGPRHNVLKLKPPMILSSDQGDELVETLGEVLTEIEEPD